MSNTYRKKLVAFCSVCDLPKMIKTIENGEKVCRCSKHSSFKGLRHRETYRKKVKVRDQKSWYKPPHSFKQMRRQQYRAQVKQALYNKVYKDKQYLPPLNKTSDQWNWT